MRKATGLLGGLLLSLAFAMHLASTAHGLPRAVFQDEPELSAQLSYKTMEKWDVRVPLEAWKPVADSIVLNGLRFSVERRGSTRLLVDTTADGKHDTRVGGAQDFLVLRGRTEARGRFVYALRLRNDGEHWTWSAGGAMAGRVRGHRVRLFDRNGNGRYDDFGRDALLIGPGTGASFLSRVVNLGGELYSLELENNGSRINLSRFTGPTATIDPHSGFEAKAKLTCAVIAGGELSFNVAETRKPMLVPAGDYHFVSGFAEGGADSVHMKRGKMASIRLWPDTTTTLRWGGPLRAEFDFRLADTQITVSPNVNFYGRLGEEYYTFKPDALPPKIVIRDRVSGRVVQSGRFGGCCGGGFSAYTGKVPKDTELEVSLEHARAMFGEIKGAQRGRAPSTPGQ